MWEQLEQANDFYEGLSWNEKQPEDDKRLKLLKEFQEYIEEETPIDFYIKSWEVDVDNIWGFSDWIYKLENYEIKTIDSTNNLYIFRWDFKFKRKGLNYLKKIEFSFHYTNWNKLVIKYRNKFYEFYINDKYHTVKKPIDWRRSNSEIQRRNWKHSGWVIINEEWTTKILKIENLKLKIEFKTD